MSPHNYTETTPTSSTEYIPELQASPRTASSSKRLLLPGVYTPTVVFFQPNEDLDLPTITSHAIRQAEDGITGLVTQGSNGEAVHLSHSERMLVTSTTRAALDSAGYEHMPVIVGCGAQSVRETIEHCVEAHSAGADAALILPPNYYAPAFKPNSRSIIEFFRDVADRSPIPVLIYNYPGAVGGLDLSSDVIIELSAHPNIVGVKLTCGNVGKLARIVAATCPKEKDSAVQGAIQSRLWNDRTQPPFLVLGGLADLTIQALSVRGHGIIAGLGNIAPQTLVRLMKLYVDGEFEKARTLQEIVARADWAAVKGGIVGTKSALQTYNGYGGLARRPMPVPGKGEAKAWEEDFAEIIEVENQL